MKKQKIQKESDHERESKKRLGGRWWMLDGPWSMVHGGEGVARVSEWVRGGSQ